MVNQKNLSVAAVYGTTDQPVTVTIKTLLAQKPMFVWCEPRPERKRLDGFMGLWTAPAELETFLSATAAVLDEARLFWPDGMMHLVAERKGARWAAFWEGELDPAPIWRQPLAPTEKKLLNSISRVEQTVLTQQDWQRYGLSKADSMEDIPSKLTIVEYRQGTQLVFWNAQVKS